MAGKRMAHARISKADSSRSQHVNSCLYVDDFAKKLAKAKEDWRPPAQEPKVEGESMEERVQVNRPPFAHDGGSRRGCFGNYAHIYTHASPRVLAVMCVHMSIQITSMCSARNVTRAMGPLSTKRRC